jgi:S1-C subfamily serine protease
MRFALPFSLSLLCWFGGAVPFASAGGIPAKKLKELKAATVYIQVQFSNQGGKNVPATGSGFVVHVNGDTALIATNSHVVNPMAGEVRTANPKVVFFSGTPQEKTLETTIVASDAVRDLAILKVTGFKDLPKPIVMDTSNEVVETMPVYAFGFPFGEGLAFGKGNPAITITKGTVSSLRNDAKGKVNLVQIDAEINPGNSGGPILDDKGNLVGVAVSKMMKARTVGFAIPLDALEDLMNGKVARVMFNTVKVDKGQADITIEALFHDPLGKLKEGTIHYRPAKEVKDFPRADKEGNVPLLADAQALPLKVEQGKAVAKFSLAGKGQAKMALAVQTTYVNAVGKKIVLPASVTYVDFNQVVVVDKLAKDDPLEKTRGTPHKVFQHKMQAGKHYVVQMFGDQKVVDPWLMVRDSQGKVLAEDDDSGGFPNSLIVFSPTKDDVYQVVATVFKGGPVGPFTLSIREETGLTLGPKGWEMKGTLTNKDYPDHQMLSPAQTFNLILKKNKTYVVDMKSKEFDPYMRLENMSGLTLKNEDVGGNGHSTLFFNPKEDGIYRVVGTTYDFKTGSFELQVRENLPPKQYDVGPDGLKLAGVLQTSDPADFVNGQLTKFRSKMYHVKLLAGQKYRIDLTSSEFDPFLRVEDNSGKELAFNNDKGEMKNAQLIFSPQVEGSYRIIVSHNDNRMGAFNLSVRINPKDP